ncbi:MAG: DEAD/DEAH box helicase family protein [Fimbriimonadaceae bacterium]|nr:DEAD/DEAH box helicase family protein [Fimbriimonadaceae bacterium]
MVAPGGLDTLDLLSQYRTGEADLVGDFYLPCLRRAAEYKRAVGYFRSSVFLIVGQESVEFARRGGLIRLVCSPSLSTADSEIMERAYANRSDLSAASICEQIDRLLADDSTEYRTRVLATLIAVGSLDLRLAVREGARGIYHEKIGIFRDSSGTLVSFLGSVNETWNGWHFEGNHEVIEVFRSWASSSDKERAIRHESYFERLWSGDVPGLETIPFPDAARRRLIEVALDDLAEVDAARLTRTQLPGSRLSDQHPTTDPRTLLPHQTAAVAAWDACGKRGILEHATGSGKTFTAIAAMRSHLTEGLPVMVLVPSRLLLEQWALEIESQLPGVVVLRAGGGNDAWRRPGRLRALTHPVPQQRGRVILATIQTAVTDDFMTGVKGGRHLMIVADEVHQTGSTVNSRIYQLESGPRLGLSATPERFGDPDGTARMFSFFGPVVPPPFTLRDAIDAGRLVEYEYYPHPIPLAPDEARSWKDLTMQLIREIGGGSPDGLSRPLSDRARMLLIRRARIAKKARNKVALAAHVLRSSFSRGQRWLVYCEDAQQLSEVMASLRSDGLKPTEYHTAMLGDMSATLGWFKSFGGILVSIRCLDEGVDIPAVDHALILASSQNPRQFIQRRGRVLRRAQDKSLARIHDAIVTPLSLEEEPEQVALLRSEFARAVEFADGALNKGASATLRSLAVQLGFDPERGQRQGVEVDEGESEEA